VVVKTEAEKNERKGEHGEGEPSEQGTRNEASHVGCRLVGRMCEFSSFMQKIFGSDSTFVVLAPLLQQSHDLPNCADAHHSNALFLAEDANENAGPCRKYP
jgi:hypothetical protein